MRLLNVFTMELKEFLGDGIPFHAILSHTWGEEEVTFNNLAASTVIFPDGLENLNIWETERKPTVTAPTSSLRGFEKLIGWCDKAKEDGIEWVWMDTCCIDKSSSAELSEAINSMFRWYSDAPLCYAYLSDVDSGENPSLESSTFRRSRWFKRGWTLQELIAPSEVIFLASDWKEIGTRESLCKVISEITRIDQDLLPKLHKPRTRELVSIAQRMSWASRRHTTRIEDQAYCLLGVFGINMPLLYGEGKNAFLRLQHEILSRSNDCSIFAWEASTEDNTGRFLVGREDPGGILHGREYSGILADSVERFVSSGDMFQIPEKRESSNEEGGILRQRISIKATKQFIKLNAAFYGPLDLKGAPCDGPGLPPNGREFICKYGTSYSINPQVSNHPFDAYVNEINENEDPSTIYHDFHWGNIVLAIVAELPCRCTQLEENSAPFCSHMIGILLDRRPAYGDRPVTRVHYPSLVKVTFNSGNKYSKHRKAAMRFMSWPLSKVEVASVWSEQHGKDARRFGMLLKTPPEFGILHDKGGNLMVGENGDKPSAELAFLAFKYHPGAKSRQTLLLPLPGVMNFSGALPELPDFAILTDWRCRRGRSSCRATVTFTSSPSFDPWESASKWKSVNYMKATFPLTDDKCVSITGRRGPEVDLYSINIEDAPSDDNFSIATTINGDETSGEAG